MNLKLNTRTPSEKTAIIEVAGELESAHVGELRDEIHRLAGSDCSHLIIDLREVSFVDSTGLGVLVGGLKKMREKGGRFSVICTHPRLLRILEISGLVKVFSIHPDPEEALAALQKEEEEP